MTVRFLDGSYKEGGSLLEGVSTGLRPSFGSDGFTSVLSPKSLILVCMLSTAYMAHFNAPKVSCFIFFGAVKDTFFVGQSRSTCNTEGYVFDSLN